MKDKAVIFLCEEIGHTKFFFNMENGFYQLGYSCVYLVLDLSVYLQLKKMTKNRVILVKNKKNECNSENAIKAKEFLENILSEQEVKKIYKAVTYYCERLVEEYNIKLFICSQGVKVGELAVKDYAIKNRCKVLFCELANIPGKTFFDPKGSNASSFLYSNIGVLDKYNVSNEEYNSWKKIYLNENFKKHVVKQAVDKKKFNWKYGIVSRVGWIYTGIKLQKMDILNKVFNFLKSKTLNLKYQSIDLKEEQYIFFPMQVASDSQIILNSDMSLIDALLYSVKEARRLNLKLVIKLHPAERDLKIIEKIVKLQKKYEFKIVTENTFFVIKNAVKIITINSTCALEAMIIGKEVDILGRSYYKFFNEDRIKKYILGYLISMDYFSQESFKVDQIKEILYFGETVYEKSSHIN